MSHVVLDIFGGLLTFKVELIAEVGGHPDNILKGVVFGSWWDVCNTYPLDEKKKKM